MCFFICISGRDVDKTVEVPGNCKRARAYYSSLVTSAYVLRIFKVVLRGFVTIFTTLMKAVECSRNIRSSCYETSGLFTCDE